MKKLLAVASGMLLVVFLLATAMAGSNAPAQGNGQNVPKDASKEKDQPKKSNVHQSQIDTVTKREKAKEHVEKMLIEREKTIAKADEDDLKGKGKKTLP